MTKNTEKIKYLNYNSKGQPLLPFFKTEQLLEDGGVEVDGNKFQKNLVCIVENDYFDAAIYCSEEEYDFIKNNPDNRPKNWVVYDNIHKLNYIQ